MAKKIFITATNTDIGKTYTTKLLLREFASRSLRVGAIKPLESGVKDGIYPDGEELLSLLKELNCEFEHIVVKDIVPISYELASAPFIAAQGGEFELLKIKQKISYLEQFCDILLIEGAGGLFVPIEQDYMMIDLIKSLKAPALLVTHCQLGCINDTLLSKEALQNRGIEHKVVFNCKKDDKDFKTISQPYFQRSGFEMFKLDEDIDTLCDVLYNLG